MTIQIQLGSVLNREYRAAITTAPKDYDGFGTLEVGPTYLNDREARLVLIAPEHFEWQTCRYASGLNATATEDTDIVYDERTIVEILYNRLSQNS